MEFGFLFNRERQLFSIGFSVTDGRLDLSHYDTLASEARLSSYLAVALGQVSREHWFKLGRSLTPTGTARALLSWTASMFENFMPLLVMRAYPDTLLDETYRAVLHRQIDYAAQHRVPWGISESADNAQDQDKNYQYRAFGVPGLGLKRGLGEDLVDRPLREHPRGAARASNRAAQPSCPGVRGARRPLRLLRSDRLHAVTRTRRCEARGGAAHVHAHHLGMSLLALDNALNEMPMQHRFHADPRVQAADLLLQERIPHQVPLKNPPIEVANTFRRPAPRRRPRPVRREHDAAHAQPQTALPLERLLCRHGDQRGRRLQPTSADRDDPVARRCHHRCLGQLLLHPRSRFRRGPAAAHQPSLREPDEYQASFAPDRAVIRRVDGGIETRTEIVVSPEDDAELRRVSITNHGDKPRRLT